MASTNTPKPEKKKKIENGETHKSETKTKTKKKNRDIEKDENNDKKKKLKLSKCISKQKDKNAQKKKKGKVQGNGEEAKTNVFPMNRIRTLIKGEDPDLRVSQEALLAINVAAEKFLELFTQDAYTCSVQDRKKSLSYKHLAHVVSKQRRYDFLSDFVPEKVKAEDALRERSASGKGGC